MIQIKLLSTLKPLNAKIKQTTSNLKKFLRTLKPSMQKHNTPVVAPTWQLLCKSIFSGFAALKLRTMYSLASWEIRQISAASYITSGQTIIIVQHKTTEYYEIKLFMEKHFNQVLLYLNIKKFRYKTQKLK